MLHQKSRDDLPQPLQFTPSPDNQSLALSQALYRPAHHLIHNLFSALLFIHHCRGFAHQKWACVVHGFVVDVVAEVFEVVLYRDGAFGCEVFYFLGAVFFPIADVGVVADAEGSALKDCLK